MDKNKIQTIIFYNAPSNEKQFLLLQMNKRRNSYWQNITGSVEHGESFIEAALREAKEETGIKPKNIKDITSLDLTFQFIDQWKANVTEKVYALECHEQWEIILDTTEHQDYKWVSEKELSESSVHYPSNYSALKIVKELQR